ncbi:MAG: hypothetical protein ACYCX4_00540 [Bacillota bacterium]
MANYVYRARCGHEVVRNAESPEATAGIVVETDKPLAGQNERVNECAGCGLRCQLVKPEVQLFKGKIQTVWVRKCKFRLVCKDKEA